MIRSVLLFLLALPLSVLAGTNEEGLAYLAANKAKEGVTTLPSGLQYRVIKAGSGTHHPNVDSSCSCHYEGKLIDGSKFDSSYDRGSPTSFAPNQVIKGWTEAMQLMVEGDKWELFIPSELGYGDSGSGANIPGGSVLVFQMEILEIQGDKVPALKCDVTKPDENCNEKEQKYITKMKDASADDITKAVTRLEGMKAKKMTDELMAWVNRRLHILKQINSVKDEL